MLSGNEVRDIVHRPGTIEGVHGYKILECRGLQLPEVFLHSGRLELECTCGMSVAIQLIGLGVCDVNRVDIHINPLCELDIVYGLLDYRQCFEAEEVHLDESRVLDDGTFILCHSDFVIS